jgi:predicted transcriptional regulator
MRKTKCLGCDKQEFFRAIRRRNVTLTTISSLLGISKQGLSTTLSKGRISPSHLSIIAKHLKFSKEEVEEILKIPERSYKEIVKENEKLKGLLVSMKELLKD